MGVEGVDITYRKIKKFF